MRSRIFLFSALTALLVACGSSSDLPAGSEATNNPTPPGASGADKERSEGGGSENTANDPSATKDVTVRLHNKTAGEVRVVKDYQAPLWLEIGTPPRLLNGYGHSWCGSKEYGHNEPVFFEQTIAPGATLDARWTATFVRFDENGSCWTFEIAPEGSFPAKACIYEGTDERGGFARDEKEHHKFPAGPGPHGPPSTWFENAPSRCLPFTIEVKKGGSVVDVEILPP